jgi:hypothetical protein
LYRASVDQLQHILNLSSMIRAAPRVTPLSPVLSACAQPHGDLSPVKFPGIRLWVNLKYM